MELSHLLSSTTDGEALCDFRNSMTNHASISDWCTGDPCANRWTVVSCGTFREFNNIVSVGQRVISIVLAQKKLFGTLPTTIGNLNGSNNFDLNHNSIAGSLPTEVGYLNSIYALCSYNNQLDGSLPWQLGWLTWYFWKLIATTFHLIYLRSWVGRQPSKSCTSSTMILLAKSHRSLVH